MMCKASVINCLETTRGAELNVKAVLIYRGELSNQHQTTFNLLLKWV